MTGLGLAIALGIAEAHGGSIGLQTTPGRGACFVVRLPVEPTPATSVGEKSSGVVRDDMGPKDTAGGGTPVAAPGADS